MHSQQLVHFSPTDPQTAVLLAGLRLGAIQELIFATLIISVAALIGLAAIRYNNASWVATASNFVMLSIALHVIYLLFTAFLE